MNRPIQAVSGLNNYYLEGPDPLPVLVGPPMLALKFQALLDHDLGMTSFPCPLPTLVTVSG